MAWSVAPTDFGAVMSKRFPTYGYPMLHQKLQWEFCRSTVWSVGPCLNIPAKVCKTWPTNVIVERNTTMSPEEGSKGNRRVVLIDFPTFELASGFYCSEQYGQTKKMRAGAVTATFVLVDGWPPLKPA